MTAVPEFTPDGINAITPGPGECVVCHFSLQAPIEAIQRFRSTMSPDEIERADRLIRPVDGEEFSVARGMLRAVLGRALEVSPESLVFAYGEHGKPAVDPGGIEFNLSHSAGHGVIALSHGAAVGIDIEGPRESSDLDKLAQRYFAPSEVEALAELPEELRRAGFYRCWSSKEALMKITGRGLSLGLDRFAVRVSPVESPGIVAPPAEFEEAVDYAWSEVSVAGDIKAVTVVGTGDVSFRYVSLDPAAF